MSPALIVTLPIKNFLDKLTPKVPNNIQKITPFCSFSLF